MSIPLPKVFWPLTITSANNKIPIRYAGGASFATASIAVATYYSAATFRAAVEAALQTAVPALGFTVTVSSVGIFSFFGSAAWTFEWATSPTEIAAANLGFNTGADSASSGNAITANHQHKNGWYARVAAAADDSIIDRRGDRQTVAMSGQNKRVQEVELTRRVMTFQFTEAAHTFTASESGTTVNAAAQRWWSEGAGRFRYWPDAATEGTSVDLHLSEETIVEFKPRRQFSGRALYEFQMECGGFVS